MQREIADCFKRLRDALSAKLCSTGRSNPPIYQGTYRGKRAMVTVSCQVALAIRVPPIPQNNLLYIKWKPLATVCKQD